MSKKKISLALELGALKFKPAKVKETTDGRLTRTGPHVLELPLEHVGRADVLADYLGTIGSEVVAVKIQPAAGGVEPWSGLGTIGARSISPSRTDAGVTSVRFTLSVSADIPTDLLPLIELRLGLAREDVSAATVSLAPTQEDLSFGG